MRIKKISPTTPANGNIENQYGTSQTNAYSEAYINSAIPTKTSQLTNDSNFATKDVATTSANGLMSASDKTLLNNETTYSTTETRVGTWIDGKPIYRFVAKGNFSNHTAGTGFYETHPNVVANVDTLISINAIRNNERSILYMKNYSNDYWLSTYFEQNGFTFSGNIGLTTSDYYVVTLEYTKTTD